MQAKSLTDVIVFLYFEFALRAWKMYSKFFFLISCWTFLRCTLFWSVLLTTINKCQPYTVFSDSAGLFSYGVGLHYLANAIDGGFFITLNEANNMLKTSNVTGFRRCALFFLKAFIWPTRLLPSIDLFNQPKSLVSSCDLLIWMPFNHFFSYLCRRFKLRAVCTLPSQYINRT